MSLLTRIFSHLGKKNYSLDEKISKYDLVIIIVRKSIMLLRGFILKLKLKHSEGLIFLGRGCIVTNCNKIRVGRTITIGNNVRINALSKEGIVLGNNVSILDNTIIECTGVLRNLGEKLIIGNNVGIAQNCFIQVRGTVEINDNVILGPYVKIFSENHNFQRLDLPIKEQGETRLNVKIGNDVWLGANSTILGGVTIGSGSIIAAGAVVTKDLPPFSIAAGVPAKIINNRKH